MVTVNVSTGRRYTLPMLLLVLPQLFHSDASFWKNGLLLPLFADCILYGCFNMTKQLKHKFNPFTSKI